MSNRKIYIHLTSTYLKFLRFCFIKRGFNFILHQQIYTYYSRDLVSSQTVLYIFNSRKQTVMKYTSTNKNKQTNAKEKTPENWQVSFQSFVI